MKRRFNLYLHIPLLFAMWLFSTPCISQSIHQNIQNTSLTIVLNDFSNKYKIKFAFDNSLTDNLKINKRIKAANMDDALFEILENSGLTYQKLNQVYLIKKGVLPPKKTNKPAYNVSGVIKDAKTKEPLPYVRIVSDVSDQSKSNSDGKFSVLTYNTDSLLVSVQLIGYEPKTIKVKPTINEFGRMELLLIQPVLQASANKILVMRQLIGDQYVSGNVRFNSFLFEEVPMLVNSDITVPLQLLPGIDGAIELTSGLNIRKTKPDKNLILLDGFSLYQNDHMLGMFSSINQLTIKDIQVNKAGIDARYGGRVGGLVELTGKTGNKTKPSLTAQIDLLSFNILAESPITKKASIIASYRRSYSEVYQTFFFNKLLNYLRSFIGDTYKESKALSFANDDSIVPTYKFSDFYTKCTWTPSSKDVLSLSIFSGNDKFKYFKNMTDSFLLQESSWGSIGVGIRWAREWTNNFSTNISTGLSRSQSVFSNKDSSRNWMIFDPPVSNKTEVNNSLTDFSMQWNTEYKYSENHYIDFGLNLNSFETFYSTIRTKKYLFFSTIDTLKNTKNSASFLATYLQYRFSKNKIKQFRLGLRANAYSGAKGLFPEPRFSLSYELYPRLLFKCSYDRSHQFVNKIPVVDFVFRDVWMISDSLRIPVLDSRQSAFGLNWKINHSYSFDVEVYRKKLNNQIVLFFDSAMKLNTTIHGLDLLLKKDAGDYTFWIAYTLSKAMSHATNLNHGEKFPYYDDQTHEIKFYNNYTYKNFIFTSALLWGSGKPYDNYNLETLSNPQLRKSYRMFSERLPQYHRMDVGVAYLFKIHKAQCKAGINIFNVYNHKNTVVKFYKYYYEPVEIYGLGICPNLYFSIQL